MKKILIAALVLIIVLAGYFILGNSKKVTVESVDAVRITEQVDLTTPSRPAEVNGTVLSVEGNIIVIANEIGKEQLTEEEKAARKEEIDSLSQEEKQALRQEEKDAFETEDIEIIVPVGITITKGGGDASGDSVIAEISELVKGTYLSIWLSETGYPESVKIKGAEQ